MYIIYMATGHFAKSNKRTGGIRALGLIIMSLTVPGCVMQDHLSDQICSEGDQVTSLLRDRESKKAEFDQVNNEVQLTKQNDASTTEQKQLVDRKTAITRDRARIESDIKAINKHRDQLIAQWEASHHGQPYIDPL